MRYVRISEDQTFPVPDGDLEWRLRYAPENVTKGDCLAAASILAAYAHLATHPAGTEATVRDLRNLRRVIRTTPKEPSDE